jgi:PhzF family phenazine biosynthesis protein
MTTPILQVDAFTDRPFYGNPAAVCFLDAPRDDAWMQAVAAEMNLAETAFLVPRPDGFHLRWFTPAVEVDLCGHATLASAHALWETGRLAPGTVARFFTRSGWLTAEQKGGLIELDFPALPTAAEPASASSLAAALGVPVEWSGRSKDNLLARLADADTVRRVEPDQTRVARLPCHGVIITAAGDGGHDFVSRYFTPQQGVDEDPVTGSAHCSLAPYWAGILGRDTLQGYQASKRGGSVHVRVVGDRVRLGGHAVTVLRGELLA